MDSNGFDPRRFVTRVGGADYLEVKWRVLWLRTQHPDAVITTELHSHVSTTAVFKAHVVIPGGGSATGWGSEGYDDFRDYLEKAETKALGRALAALGFGTQFTPDFDFAGGGEKVVDAPVRLARQRQLVDVAEDRNRARQPMQHAPAMPAPDEIDYDDPGPPDDMGDLSAGVPSADQRVLDAARDLLGAEPMPAKQQGMDMPRGQGYPSDSYPEQRARQMNDRMTDRQESFLTQMLIERNYSVAEIDAEALELFGCPQFDRLNRRDASAWIERLKGIPPVGRSAPQNAQNAPQRTETPQAGGNTQQSAGGGSMGEPMTDKQKGKIWFDAKEKLGMEADEAPFNDLMMLRYGVPLPMLTKAQASEVIKTLGDDPTLLLAQLPKEVVLRSPVADYWVNRAANAGSMEQAQGIAAMIKGRYTQIEAPFGQLLAEELKRWGVGAE